MQNFLEIENQINKKNNWIAEYGIYNFLKQYEEEIFSIFNNFKKEKEKILKNLKEEKIFIKNMNLKYNNTIKSEEDYILIVFSLLIVKTFMGSKDRKKEETNLEKMEIYKYESDFIINNITKEFIFFTIWLEIYNNNKKKIEKNKKIRMIVYLGIIILQNEKIIDTKKQWVNGKTLNFYTINIKNKDFIFIDLYEEKFKIYQRNKKEIYIYIDHYSNIQKIFKSNKHSDESVEMDINSIFFKNLFEIKAKIDYELLNYFLLKKLEKTEYTQNNLYENYSNLIEELKKSIHVKNIKLISEISQKISILSDLIRINNILKIKKDCFFYFPVTICFRGRTHYSSSISFTLYKEFRHCLYIGEYENFEIPYHPLNEKVNKIIETYTYKLKNIKKYRLEDENKTILISIIWILISIAKIDKKLLGESIHIKIFIDHGIAILNDEIELKNLDEYEYIELLSLKKMIDEISKKIYIKRLISKDATASCFQHLIKILGSLSEEAKEWCNLKSENTWYDTYIYILKNWQNNNIELINKDQEDLFKKIFTRKSIKKPTMTVQYGSSFRTCFAHFKSEINTDNEISKSKELVEWFKNYYAHISKDVGLLKKDPKKIIEKLKELNYKIELDDKSKINLVYKKIEKKQIKVTYKNKRYTKNEIILTDGLNIKKIRTSIRANYIHTHDSAIIRYIISIIPIPTIHDCFLIDYMSTSFLISAVNEAMQKSHHNLNLNDNFNTNEIFSIFILI